MLRLFAMVAASAAARVGAQEPRAATLALGFAVDTSPTALARWGMDPVMRALPTVVRIWRDYLAVRTDAPQRGAFWSSAEGGYGASPDLLAASERFILDGAPTLIEALPLVAGDSSRWQLRTLYQSRVGC